MIPQKTLANTKENLSNIQAYVSLSWFGVANVIAAIINLLSFQSHTFYSQNETCMHTQNLNCTQIYEVNKNVCSSADIVVFLSLAASLLHPVQIIPCLILNYASVYFFVFAKYLHLKLSCVIEQTPAECLQQFKAFVHSFIFIIRRFLTFPKILIALKQIIVAYVVINIILLSNCQNSTLR